MTPQSNILVAAPVDADREAELRSLLASMNAVPGRANPANPIVPFEHFGQLHFARFVILEDQTLDDIHTAYGLPRVDYPVILAFLADFDGTADDFRSDLARRAADGLRRIFACCRDFTPDRDLALWMKQHENPAASAYVNWSGRTASQIREDNALRLALENHLQNNPAAFVGKRPQQIHEALREFVKAETRLKRVTLTEPPPTPCGWRFRNFCHLIGLPLILLVLLPVLVLYLPVFVYQLRSRETSDLEIAPRVDQSHEQKLSSLEDHDVTNQFTAMGSIKPGLFRRWTLTFLLWILNWSGRHMYARGHLARVSTIHFARWAFLNDKNRLIFASNYDGSLESYMDDFINKVGWGLNLVFSNGIGYPTTSWLVLGGAKNEQKFKQYLRRHELPTEVWYKAYPGLTAVDLKRNTLIRQGIERSAMSDAQLRKWVALF